MGMARGAILRNIMSILLNHDTETLSFVQCRTLWSVMLSVAFTRSLLCGVAVFVHREYHTQESGAVDAAKAVQHTLGSVFHTPTDHKITLFLKVFFSSLNLNQDLYGCFDCFDDFDDTTNPRFTVTCRWAGVTGCHVSYPHLRQESRNGTVASQTKQGTEPQHLRRTTEDQTRWEPDRSRLAPETSGTSGDMKTVIIASARVRRGGTYGTCQTPTRVAKRPQKTKNTNLTLNAY